MRRRLAPVFCLFLTCGALEAQPAPKKDPGWPFFPPDLVLTHEKEIALEDSQRNYIREEVLKVQPSFTSLQFKLQDAMEGMTELLRKHPVDETQVIAQLDKVLAVERDLKRAQVGLMVRIKNRLTPEQQGRLQALREAK